MRMDSCLLACMECSCLVFPVIGKRLCVLDPGSGQLLDGDDQPVDLMNWKAKLPHCKKRCPGTGNGPFARIDVRLDFGELEFLQDMLKYALPHTPHTRPLNKECLECSQE